VGEVSVMREKIRGGNERCSNLAINFFYVGISTDCRMTFGTKTIRAVAGRLSSAVYLVRCRPGVVLVFQPVHRPSWRGGVREKEEDISATYM